MNDIAGAVIGIDVSKRKLDIALVINGRLKPKVFSNSGEGHVALLKWLQANGADPASSHLCLEATGPYSEAVATGLFDAGWKVSVVNPARVKGFAQSELSRNKTDRADAALLARFCAAMRPEGWQAPSTEWRLLRALVDRVQSLKDMRQQELNRIEASEAMAQSAVVAMVRDHIAWLDTQIDKIERDINDHIDRHPRLKNDAELMKSIPGIGDTTTAKLLAYLGDVRRFCSAKALAAYIGVTPRQRQSGTSIKGRTVISRAGHADARKALYMPGLVSIRHNEIVIALAERLRSRGLASKAIVGAAMRKLAHQIYGVIRSGVPFDPKINNPRLAIQDGI